METNPLIDTAPIAKHLKLDVAIVRRVTELLDEGNTVPFITRFRKDQTGGMNEPQIRSIEKELNREKLLCERKETILRSIESRGQLNEVLAKQVRDARSLSALEDIYLPYKPKKQSLASIARSKGLEPLAREIIAGSLSSEQLEGQAAGLIDEANELVNVEDVFEGIGHLIAEHFGNEPQLRAQLRRFLWANGRLVSKKIETPEEDEIPEESVPVEAESSPVESHAEPLGADANEQATSDSESPAATDAAGSEEPETRTVVSGEPAAPMPEDAAGSGPVAEATPDAADQDAGDSAAASSGTPTEPEAATEPEAPTEPEAAAESTDTPSADAPSTESPSTDASSKTSAAASRRDQRREMRRRRRERLVQSFKDYFDFSDPIGRIPHHRILAINRGERTKVLRVKIDCSDLEGFQRELEAKVISADHPQVDFLKKCLQDAFGRLLNPGIEREVRRELNDRAEEHAVNVFARNLRKLLLQPPLHQYRVIAIDPGFRSGCKLVALDEFGSVLGHTFINLLGKEQQKQTGRSGLVEFVRTHRANAIAIGNGAACRETESLVADVLTNELKDEDVGYLIVNEAGTAVYSTSDLGREELPEHDATVRSAVSIGRRALDPLSELVKIDPASIGVGLYQHDVKAKHLRASLDAVVESCVNYVGVDVNSASPALLRYVSGLNSLTARRIYEHRQQHGPFKNREQLKEVSGIGESTYVQAAGFLKIVDGENPLDGTWIHPESYPVASRVLEAIGLQVSDLRPPMRSSASAQPDASAEAGRATSEFGEGLIATDETSADEAPTIAPSVELSPDQASSNAPEEETVPTAAESTAATAQASDAETELATTTEANVALQVAAESEDEPVTEVAPDTTPTSSGQSEEDGVATNGLALVSAKLADVNADALAADLRVGKLLLKDMLNALARPGRDPREDLPAPIFRRGILKLEDLKPGMELAGTVLNVVDFGAFVDIGLVDSGLIHVSRLADRYIADPHDVVSVGDILRVWVVEVDQKRRRVSLTAIEPGTERPKPSKERRKPRPDRQAGRSEPKGRTGKPKRGKPHGGQRSKQYKPKSAPKPVVPITKEMEDGTEPMRTFGDLKQLFDKRKKGGSK